MFTGIVTDIGTVASTTRSSLCSTEARIFDQALHVREDTKLDIRSDLNAVRDGSEEEENGSGQCG